MLASLQRSSVISLSINPALLPFCRAAYDASLEVYTNGAQVTSLTDRSGNGLTLTQAGTANLLYRTNEVNGLGVVDFKGTDGYLIASTAADWNWLKDGNGVHIIALVMQPEDDPNRLNMLADTCGASSVNYGTSFYLDDRAGSSRSNQASYLIAKGSSGALVVDCLAPAEYVQPKMWMWAEATYAGKNFGAMNLADNIADATISIDGLANIATSGGNYQHNTANNSTYPLNIGRLGSGSLYAVMRLGCMYLFDRVLPPATRSAVMRYLTKRWKVGYSRLLSGPGYGGNCGFIKKRSGVFVQAFSAKPMHLLLPKSAHTVLKKSPDLWNWDIPETTVTPLVAGKGTQPGGMLAQLTNGTMLLGGFTHNGSTDIDAFVYRSTDGGVTWTASTVTHGFTIWSALQSNFLELADGSIVTTVYGLDTGVGQLTYIKVLRSTDDGVTFTNAVTLHNGNVVGGNSDLKTLTEAFLVKLAGAAYGSETIYAIFRNDTDVTFDNKTSTNSGATWGARAAAIPSITAAPYVIEDSSGNLYCCGRVSPPANQRGILHWSSDDGATWSTTPVNLGPIDGFNHYSAGFELETGLLAISTLAESDSQSNTIDPATSPMWVKTYRTTDILSIA
jgi:hypothetical protein